jgi:hypothetical protein
MNIETSDFSTNKKNSNSESESELTNVSTIITSPEVRFKDKKNVLDEREKLNDLNTSTTFRNENKSLLQNDDIAMLDIEKDINVNKDKFLGHVIEKEPRRLGNTFAFFYKNGEPKIIIGPHCNLFYFYL